MREVAGRPPDCRRPRLCDGFAGSNAIADAFVDPVFSFGPGVDPLVYSFEFSNGIGNSVVPEPGTFALLGVGLLAFGLFRRGVQ